MEKESQNKIKQMKNEPIPSLEIVNQCLIIRLGSELDHHYSISLREKSDRLIEKGSIKHIIFDFAGAKFMDSSGIGVIMGRYKRVIFTGGKVAVVGVGNSIDRILNLSGLYKIIEKYETVKDAISAL